MWDVVLDALIDSSIAAPFLLAIFLLIEFLERNALAKAKTVRLLNGKLAPLAAGGIGLIPQCGFSVMATDLYCQNYLKTGTLIAFFVATSDEALPILLTNRNTVGVTWIVILVKIVYAVALGYLINLLDKRDLRKISDDIVLEHDERKPHDHSHGHDERAEHGEDNAAQEHGQSDATVVHVSDGCCHHEMTERGGFWNFVKHPLLHTLKIFVYIFVVNAVFGLLLYRFEEPIRSFTATLGFAQSFVTAAIGLVPNCASSVIITGMYAEGVVDFAALLAGLISNSGIALAILFKDKGKLKRNFVILAVMYLVGVAAGIAAYFITQI
ncbi:MAG: arsenic efflux protein [Corallococcus sp.]|nr:arsenic efflux protein [Bacillota bacterium]MCM1534247.1 arsenic efflux protein [Corallococcus sp.]